MSVSVKERRKKEREYTFAWERANQHIYNKTLERTASYDKRSVVLSSRSDWLLLTTTRRLMKRLGIIVPLCIEENEKRDRTVVATANVQSFASIILFDD